MTSTVLVVDDDSSIRRVLRLRLEAEGYRVLSAGDPERALQQVRDHSDVDLALVDLRLGEADGVSLMGELHALQPDLSVVILTAHGTIDSAVDAMQKGACNYVTKPFNNTELLIQIRHCLEKSNLNREVNRLRQQVARHFGFDKIIGRSAAILQVLDQVAKAARSDAAVFIQGESGTGKELIANTLHLNSQRRHGPFVAINCAAIPENLLESELFGYEKGAFTGANRRTPGHLERAHGGSFFMDEITEMPMTMQAKFLRVLQEKEVTPLGGGKTVTVDVRFIASSNRIIEELVKDGMFREDLFYRIHVIAIALPPLRDRREDIPLLADYFLKKFALQADKAISGFTPEAMQKLMIHAWPGNVRELENTIEGAVALATSDRITDELLLRSRERAPDNLKPLKDAKDDFERGYLQDLMDLTRGNVSQAAKLAGKYRADLYALLKKYGISPDDFRQN